VLRQHSAQSNLRASFDSGVVEDDGSHRTGVRAVIGQGCALEQAARDEQRA
jgi:hypothetical protein